MARKARGGRGGHRADPDTNCVAANPNSLQWPALLVGFMVGAMFYTLLSPSAQGSRPEAVKRALHPAVGRPKDGMGMKFGTGDGRGGGARGVGGDVVARAHGGFVLPAETGEPAQSRIRRCDTQCCGIGDRMAYMIGPLHAQYMEGTNIAMNWGPCADRPSIISHMFNLPVYTSLDHSKNGTPDGKRVFSGQDQIIYSYIPNATNPLEEPFPSYTGQVAQKCLHFGRNRYFPDNLMVVSRIMYRFLRQLFSSLRPAFDHYLAEVRSQMAASKHLISIHVRTGNMKEDGTGFDNRFASAHRDIKNKTEHMAQYTRLADDIAKKLGWDDDYAIFVASDSYKTAELLRTVTDRPVIDRTQLLKITDGHPMLFANLHNDNAGMNCKFEWFLDPFLDLILLVEADVFIAATDSGFISSVENIMYNEGKLFCRAHSKYQIECFRSLNSTRDAVLRSTLADGPQYGSELLDALGESWQFAVGPDEGEVADRVAVPVSAVYCSREGHDCQCKGMVWFGIGGRYHKRHSTGNAKCMSAWFAGDPTPGYLKNCWCETGAPPDPA